MFLFLVKNLNNNIKTTSTKYISFKFKLINKLAIKYINLIVIYKN